MIVNDADDAEDDVDDDDDDESFSSTFGRDTHLAKYVSD